jgi:ABC-type transport system involved in cytochrome c biogenesis permease subunit
MRPAGVALLAGAIIFHTYGLVLRVLILSRPPVSNMYESVVYMNWALMVTAAIFAIVRRQASAASIGALISAIIMIYADLLPLDSGLEVLVPVLRSNYWLTIHVLTIVSSYGVLGLAMGLGHRHLILDMRKKLSKAESDRSSHLIHRVIQVGLLMLGIGTVLGGVWANESWGRFWGWDPKETWALITFLGYLIIVHLRFSKKMSNWWLAMSSILGFFLVLMTWYGVNFVLGRGLHSYGQGAGGMEWVILFLAVESAFIIWALAAKAGFLSQK